MRRSTAVALVGLLALAGCSDSPDATAPSATESSPDPTPSPTVDEEQAAEAAARAYYQVEDEMLRSGVLDMDRLQELVEEPYATEAGKKIVSVIDPGFRRSGEVVYSTESVTLDGQSAVVATCIDWGSSTMAIGDVVATNSPPGVNELTLSSASGSWKVTGSTSGGECSTQS